MKKATLWVLMYSIFLVIFNIVFFMLGGTQHSSTVWLSYGFIHLAYLSVVATSSTVLKSSSIPTLGLTLSTISFAYFIAELIVSVVFILIGADILKLALTIQIIIFGAYAVMLIANMISNTTTEESITNSKIRADYIKECSTRIKMLKGKIPDQSIEKDLEKLYDLFHSSPSKGLSSNIDIEAAITERLAYLELAIKSANCYDSKVLIGEISELVNQRNQRILSSN